MTSNLNSTFKNNNDFFEKLDQSQDFNSETYLKNSGKTNFQVNEYLSRIHGEARGFIEEANSSLQQRAQEGIDERMVAYVAGFLDGDGTINVTTSRTSAAQGYRFPYKFQLNLSFTQSKKRRQCLEDLKSLLGGVGNIREKENTYEYNITGNKNIKEILMFLLPYLRVKKRQAALALIFIEGKTKGLSSVEFLERAALVEELSSYNDTKNREHTAGSIKQTLIERGMLTQEEQELTKFIL